MARFRMKQNVGPHQRNGEWVRPGDVIECEEEELRNVIDKFDLLPGNEKQKSTTTPEPTEETDTDDSGPADEEEGVDEEDGEEPDEEEVGLELENKGRGKWNVINPATGEAINDKPLTKKEAEKLLRKNY